MVTTTHTRTVKLLGTLGADLDDVVRRNVSVVRVGIDKLLVLCVPRQDLDLADSTLLLDLELKADTVLRVARPNNETVSLVLVPSKPKGTCHRHRIKDKRVVRIVLDNQTSTICVGRRKLEPCGTSRRRRRSIKRDSQEGTTRVVTDGNHSHSVVAGRVGKLRAKRAVVVGVIVVPLDSGQCVKRHRHHQARPKNVVRVLVDPLGLQKLEAAVEARSAVTTTDATLVLYRGFTGRRHRDTVASRAGRVEELVARKTADLAGVKDTLTATLGCAVLLLDRAAGTKGIFGRASTTHTETVELGITKAEPSTVELCGVAASTCRITHYTHRLVHTTWGGKGKQRMAAHKTKKERLIFLYVILSQSGRVVG
jgi:hypothetical protein